MLIECMTHINKLDMCIFKLTKVDETWLLFIHMIEIVLQFIQ